MTELPLNPETTALILAAHGSSRDTRINQPLFALAEKIRENSNFAVVTPAFLDGSPDIRTIVDDLDQTQIIVVPFMASAGYYTEVVFPEAVGRPGNTTRMTPPIGEYPHLADLIEQRLEVIFHRHTNEEKATIVIVGHGTRKNKNSCRTTIDLVQELRTRNPVRQIEFAFIDQNPAIDLVASRVKTPTCVIIPFLMGLGPHTTMDVPNAFGIKKIDDAVFRPEFEFPCVQSVDTHAGERRTVILDAPVGTYPQWADVSIELANATLQDSGFETEAVQ